MLCLLFAILIHTVLYSQDDGFINGIVLDSVDRKAVSFATVRIKDQAIGVITNEDGTFRIPRKLNSYGDSIEISSLGYKLKFVRFSDFETVEPKSILLQPAIEELEEVVVTADRTRLNAKEIITKAIYRIPYNYPNGAFSYLGYYRDYQWIENQYVNLNEAIVEVYDKGFTEVEYDSLQARILSLVKNEEFPRDSALTVAYDYSSSVKTIPNATIDDYGGNELLILLIHDAIRNYNTGTFSFVDTFRKDFLPNHKFAKEAVVPYSDDMIYEIGIYKDLPNLRVKGSIYISATDYGILRLNYQVYVLESGDKGAYSFTTELPLYGVLVEYERTDKYYLKYLSFKNHFEISPPPKFYAKTLAFDLNSYNFEIVFSQPIAKEDATDLRNYKLKYKKKKIPFDKISLDEERKIVTLYPVLTPRLNKLLSDFEVNPGFQKDFSVKFGKIKSESGEILDRTTIVRGDQYREFFVQQVNKKGTPPKVSELMEKGKPIFGEQPLNEKDLKENYWMNTPLKN